MKHFKWKEGDISHVNMILLACLKEAKLIYYWDIPNLGTLTLIITIIMTS